MTRAVPGGAASRRGNVLSALKYRNYRLYFGGLVLSITGYWVNTVAQSWLVYELTDSPLYLGLVGLCTSIPTITLSLFGGVLADRIERKKLLMVTQVIYFFLMLALGTLVLMKMIEVWHVLAFAVVTGTVMAFDQPTRQALIPTLVEKEDLMNAIALGSSAWNLTRIVGPSLGGILLSTVGTAGCFYAASIGYLAMVGALWLMRMPPAQPQRTGATMLQNLVEGLKFIWHNQIFFILITMTFLNSIFGMSYATLMPVFAKDVLDIGTTGYGLLMSATGIGALIGTMAVAFLGEYKRKGWLMLAGSALFGSTLVLFSLSRLVPLSWGLLVLVGLFNAFYMTTVNTVLQARVPDMLRGRVMSVYGLAYSLMPLGGMQGGAVATFLGTPAAVAIGGVVVAAYTLFVTITKPTVRET